MPLIFLLINSAKTEKIVADAFYNGEIENEVRFLVLSTHPTFALTRQWQRGNYWNDSLLQYIPSLWNWLHLCLQEKRKVFLLIIYKLCNNWSSGMHIVSLDSRSLKRRRHFKVSIYKLLIITVSHNNSRIIRIYVCIVTDGIWKLVFPHCLKVLAIKIN